MEGLGRFRSVEACAVTEEDVLRLESCERCPRREEAQGRVDAERLAGGAEVVEAAERVRADEDPRLGKPERDFPPEALPDDREGDERRALNVRERRHVEREAEAAGDGCAVPFVTVEELDDACWRAEHGDPLVKALAVDDVRQPDSVLGADRVRRPPKPFSLDAPPEAVLELVVEKERHGETMARGSHQC